MLLSTRGKESRLQDSAFACLSLCPDFFLNGELYSRETKTQNRTKTPKQQQQDSFQGTDVPEIFATKLRRKQSKQAAKTTSTQDAGNHNKAKANQKKTKHNPTETKKTHALLHSNLSIPPLELYLASLSVTSLEALGMKEIDRPFIL
ncbi:hypothetical protein QYF36_016373 [Acer negundo]|nr:hypothetical protein QYF36_016373 [Acer negundo]